ncbi:MAG: DUF1015 family protein [Euzebya sp.]
MRFSPFHALRYDPAVAGPPLQTSAPPYDAIDRERYARHHSANPNTVLQLLAAETAVTEGGFVAARKTLDQWRRSGVVVQDRQRGLFVYEQSEMRHGIATVQRGIVGAVDLADVDEGNLLLHEEVDDQRVALRADRLRQVPVDLTPVVALYLGDAGEQLAPLIAQAQQLAPIVAFMDEGAMQHRVWRITNQDAIAGIVAAFQGVTGVLADGHHRVAAALRIRQERRRLQLPPTRWEQTTVMAVDATSHGPRLRPIHRLVHDQVRVSSAGMPSVPGFQASPWHGGSTALQKEVISQPGVVVGVITGQGSWLLSAINPTELRREVAEHPALQALDAQVVSSVVLPAIASGATVTAVIDADQIAAQLAQGLPGTLIVVSPPTPEQVMQVARAGLRMPAKTTSFRPKPRAGLIMRLLEGMEHDDIAGTPAG